MEMMLSIEGPAIRDARPPSGHPHAFSVPTVCMCDYSIESLIAESLSWVQIPPWPLT